MPTNKPQIITKQRSSVLSANALLDVFLLLLCLGGTVGCLITGFDLPVFSDVLIIAVIGIAIACPLIQRCFVRQYLPHLGILILCGIWFLCRTDMLLDGILLISAYVVRFLCWGYPAMEMPSLLKPYAGQLPYIGSSAAVQEDISAKVTEALLIIAVLIALLWCFLYSRNHVVFLAALIPVPFFILCFLIIEITIPDFWSLLTIFTYWLLLLFTRSALRLQPRAIFSQTAILLIPAILLITMTYRYCPKDNTMPEIFQSGYNAILDLTSSIQMTFRSRFGNSNAEDRVYTSAEGNTVSLSNLDSKRYRDQPVMKIKGSGKQTVYLRENTYKLYTSDEWSNPDTSTVRVADDQILTVSSVIISNFTTWVTDLTLADVHSDILFTPYYFSGSSAEYQTNGDQNIIKRSPGDTYTVHCRPFSLEQIRTASFTTDQAPFKNLLTGYYLEHLSEYTQIDDQTKALLLEFLESNDITPLPSLDITKEQYWSIVDEITLLTQSCAEYSLDVEKKPDNGKDFVLWFLEDAEAGYCTHFATTEVMLLRACGIPARLAVGFLAKIKTPITWNPILDSDAHAWVEVFYPQLGWVPIEATPPGSVIQNEQDDLPTTTSDSVTESPETTETIPEPVITTEGDTQPPKAPTADATTPAESDTDELDSSPTQSPPLTLSQKLLRIVLLVILISIGLLTPIAVLMVRRHSKTQKLYAALHAPSDKRNDAALYLFRYIHAIAKLHTESVPDTLYTLAEKAKFSQHTLTDAEFSAISAYYEKQAADLKTADTPLRRLRHQWIDVLY